MSGFERFARNSTTGMMLGLREMAGATFTEHDSDAMVDGLRIIRTALVQPVGRNGEDEGGFMRVKIGSVAALRDVKSDKAQVVKIAEEWGEVYSAWERCTDEDLAPGCYHREDSAHYDLVDECADVIQATCNLLASIGVDDMTWAMRRCEERNRERGRITDGR